MRILSEKDFAFIEKEAVREGRRQMMAWLEKEAFTEPYKNEATTVPVSFQWLWKRAKAALEDDVFESNARPGAL